MTTTRFAPSPTGYIHVGNLRTALFNYLIAAKSGGQFILRLDDTDPERSKQEYADAIMEDLEWLGLTWDRVEKQSDRLDRYEAAAQELRDMGRFYECFETPTELDLKRKKQLNMGKPPVYDRAALVAFPEPMRKRYAQTLTEQLPAGVGMLLITLEFDDAEGPPFSVTEEEVQALYGDRFSIEKLTAQTGMGRSGRAEVESVYIMRDRR